MLARPSDPYGHHGHGSRPTGGRVGQAGMAQRSGAARQRAMKLTSGWQAACAAVNAPCDMARASKPLILIAGVVTFCANRLDRHSDSMPAVAAKHPEETQLTYWRRRKHFR